MNDNSLCSACGSRVSSAARVCPECGADENTDLHDDPVDYDLVFGDDSKPERQVRGWQQYMTIGLIPLVLVSGACHLHSGYLMSIPVLLIGAGIFYIVIRARRDRPAGMEEQLHEDLLRRARGDARLLCRLVEYERRCNPAASREQLLRDAIDRWDRDRSR